MYTTVQKDVIKTKINKNLGKKVNIHTIRGRKKVDVIKGTIVNVYPNLFTIKTKDKEHRLISYSYVDVLTDVIKLKYE